MASAKYAGVLLYAIKPGVARNDDKLVFLLAGEPRKNGTDLVYGDLGGKTEGTETVEATAVREMMEEIMYLLPPVDVSSDPTVLTDTIGTVYLHKIPYSDNLPVKFKSALGVARRHGMLSTAKKGYFEVRDLKWVTMNQLKVIVNVVKRTDVPIDGERRSFNAVLFLKNDFVNVMSVIVNNFQLQ